MCGCGQDLSNTEILWKMWCNEESQDFDIVDGIPQQGGKHLSK